MSLIKLNSSLPQYFQGYKKIKSALLQKAQDYKEWFIQVLSVRESRQDQDIQKISQAVLDHAHRMGYTEEDAFIHWENFILDAVDWADNQNELNTSLGISFSPQLEVGEYALAIGMIYSAMAETHLKGNSFKGHLIAAHFLIVSTEARDYWIAMRGSTRSRIPDKRFLDFENKIERKQKEFWLRELNEGKRANFKIVREKGVQTKKLKARQLHEQIAQINADLLKQPRNEGWKIDARADYIAKKVGRKLSYVRKLIAKPRKTNQT